ncbi:MAG: hypothetical protein SFX73_37595 [Kofleriaceae bacterium]|nr:hypothetical protein [Kofleriaceae bacterium]
MRHHLFASLLVSSLSLTGCVLHHQEGGDGGMDGSHLGSTTPPSPTPVASGPYVVTSNIEITIEALLPEPAANLVSTARDFSVDPAHTLITLAEDAGVPAVGTLRDVLPDVVESKLEGWLNDEIGRMTINGLTIPELAAEVVALAETALTQVNVQSELAIAGGTATHRLTALDLRPTGLASVLPLGNLPGEVTTATTTVRTTGTTLSIGDHSYSVAYGEYAWQALEAKFVADYGASIRDTLGSAVNCPLVAQRVASKCVFSVCVGHAAELTSLCERGLDEVVERAHAKLATFTFDALRFEAGTATLVDADGDLVAEQLTGGVWTAEINAGQGLRHAPATFTASK